MRHSREFIACILWTSAFALMVAATAANTMDGSHPSLFFWALFVCASAHQFTGWALLRRNESPEVSVEQIIEVVDALHEGRHQVSRLH